VAKKGRNARVAVTGAGAEGVFRWEAAEEALARTFSPKALIGLPTPEPGSLNGDIHASAEYRSHLIGVMTARAIDLAKGKAVAA
jgi:carbon-monoxide dehydrogenase medium subunit